MNVSKKQITNNSTTQFIAAVHTGITKLAVDDLHVEFALAVLEYRLNKVNRLLSEGLDSDEAFQLAIRAMDLAIGFLTGHLGVSARLTFMQAVLAGGNMPPRWAIAA